MIKKVGRNRSRAQVKGGKKGGKKEVINFEADAVCQAALGVIAYPQAVSNATYGEEDVTRFTRKRFLFKRS